MGDLRQYEDEDDFKAAFSKHWPDKAGKWRELWNFANEVDKGDVVVANRGRTSIVGIGKSEGEYYFDSTRTEYKHCLKVNWENTQEQAIPANAQDIVGDWGSPNSQENHETRLSETIQRRSNCRIGPRRHYRIR